MKVSRCEMALHKSARARVINTLNASSSQKYVNAAPTAETGRGFGGAWGDWQRRQLTCGDHVQHLYHTGA